MSKLICGSKLGIDAMRNITGEGLKRTSGGFWQTVVIAGFVGFWTRKPGFKPNWLVLSLFRQKTGLGK